MSAQREPFDWNAWLWWVSLTALSTLTAIFVILFIVGNLGLSALSGVGDGESASTAFPVAIAPVFALGGAIIGAAQWLVLRGRIKRAGWWVLATAGGWMAGYLWSYLLFPSTSETATIVELLLPWLLYGLSAGLLQWLILRHFYHRSGLWVPTAGLAMVIGTSGWLVGGTFGGTFLWLASGAFSGWILLRVLPSRRHRSEERGSGTRDQGSG